jgi:hypothetical protein
MPGLLGDAPLDAERVAFLRYLLWPTDESPD